ncbi:MAG: ferritin [Methanoregulaceae archaeon PtaB.Bin108]|nr:MAG: ferritin [Methanoregulaceae archaeon PtaB.Bin108]OPY46474.1 MAG: ferritin [Methanoregulaceae archaeon PtaU1.Bin222]
MLKKSIEDALNKQLNAELYSSYLYLSMSAYCETVPLKGFAKWLRMQAEEEKAHGMKFFDYLIEAGGTVKLVKIDAPKTEWKSVGDVFNQVYEHEKKVTALINGLMDLAIKEKDYATQNYLGWFVKEQVEEEANASEIQAQIKMMGDIVGHLFWLDHELGKRK